MQTPTGLELKIQEMAQRIHVLREIVGLTAAEMAQKTGVSEAEDVEGEAGNRDLNFAFLYRCAQALKVDITDIIEGTSPRLAGYTLTRQGEGQQLEKAPGLTYFNLAYAFKNRIAEPLYVHSKFSADAQLRPIDVTTHEGQECDIAKGTSIFLYTDGVTEAEDKAKVLYSDERLLDLLGKQGKNTPQMIAENVLDDINKHVNGAEQSDDITIMCIHYK